MKDSIISFRYELIPFPLSHVTLSICGEKQRIPTTNQRIKTTTISPYKKITHKSFTLVLQQKFFIKN